MKAMPEHWPEELKQRLSAFRELPPDNTSMKVFWYGTHSKNGEDWKRDLPYLVEALGLKQGAKWRDVKVWLNPFSTFGKYLYNDFITAFSLADLEVQQQVLENIKKVCPEFYEKMSCLLQENEILSKIERI